MRKNSLSADENLWLRRLSNRLDPFEVAKTREEIMRQGKGAELDAFQSVIFNANPEAMQEAIKMTKLQRGRAAIMKTLEEEGFTAEWEARGRTEGKAEGKIIGFEEGKLAIARNMVKLGLPFETIVSATQLDPEKVRDLYQVANRIYG